MLKVWEFGLEAIAYVRDQLSRGGNFAAALQNLPLEEGKVLSYLPAGLDPAIAREFEESASLSSGLDVSGYTEKTGNFIYTFLGTRSKRYAVFETYAHEDTPFLSTKAVPYFIYSGDAYYFLTSQNVTLDDVLDAVAWAKRYPFVCALTSLPKDQLDIGLAQDVPSEVLGRFAARAEHVIVGAYDDEGYLIWSRD